MNLETAFGSVLKDFRVKKGLSQEELAYLCNLDRTYISLLERGRRKPTLNVIFSICDALKINPSEMIRKVELIVKEDG